LRHPIWGGQGNDVLAGDAGGVRNDLMHGGAGDDVFYPGLGDDEIWGDAGIDSVVLPGRLSDYTVTELSSDFTKIVLDGGSRGTKTIYYCEFIHFDDVRLPVKAFHAQSVR
jgi:Ca2+-binding RTX toxin-like protein